MEKLGVKMPLGSVVRVELIAGIGLQMRVIVSEKLKGIRNRELA